MNQQQDRPPNPYIQERQYSRPYNSGLPKITDEYAIRRLTHEVNYLNADYMAFFPEISLNRLAGLMGYLWMCVGVFAVIGTIYTIFYVYFDRGLDWLDIISLVVGFLFAALMFGVTYYVSFKEFLKPSSMSNQTFFLKEIQKVCYYELDPYRKDLPILKIYDYRCIVPLKLDLKTTTGTMELLTLFFMADDEKTVLDSRYVIDVFNDPEQQWNFIRTYMERPAEELPLDAKSPVQTWPTDMSGSLFACADAIYARVQTLDEHHRPRDDGYGTGANRFILWLRSCTFTYLDLDQANNIRKTQRAINDPQVQALLEFTRSQRPDPDHNPYPVRPMTEERRLAFLGQNTAVNRRWQIAIGVNASIVLGIILYVTFFVV
ncbi:MAG: hypothetical protein VXW65_00845 [Pseudomonadota bacterium]|nr:hypothetical protein [Pseudomonadota bacterium]